MEARSTSTVLRYRSPLSLSVQESMVIQYEISGAKSMVLAKMQRNQHPVPGSADRYLLGLIAAEHWGFGKK